MSVPLVDLTREYAEIQSEIDSALNDVLHSGYFIQGDHVESFESEFATFVGADHGIGVNSGSDALTLALKALDVGAGDEVITVSHTFVSTANAVVMNDARPVFVDVDNDMRVAQEEIFGPVVVVIPFGDDEDPVEIANDVDYGLTAGVFTNDVRRALSAVRDVEAGNVYVNKWFGDTTQTPFGGYKHSGMGREKGLEALDSYLQTKNVAINLERSSGGDLPGA